MKQHQRCHSIRLMFHLHNISLLWLFCLQIYSTVTISQGAIDASDLNGDRVDTFVVTTAPVVPQSEFTQKAESNDNVSSRWMLQEGRQQQHQRQQQRKQEHEDRDFFNYTDHGKESYNIHPERGSLQVQLRSIRRTQYWLPCYDGTPTTVSATNSLTTNNRRRTAAVMTASSNSSPRIDYNLQQEYNKIRKLTAVGSSDDGDLDILDETIGTLITVYGDEILDALYNSLLNFSSSDRNIIEEHLFFDELSNIIYHSNDKTTPGTNYRHMQEQPSGNENTNNAFFHGLTDLVPDETAEDNTSSNENGAFFGELTDFVPDEADTTTNNEDTAFFGGLTELVPDEAENNDDNTSDNENTAFFGGLTDLVPDEDDNTDDNTSDNENTAFFGGLTDLVPDEVDNTEETPSDNADTPFFGGLTDLVPDDVDNTSNNGNTSFFGGLTDLVPDNNSFFGSLSDLVETDTGGGSFFGDLSSLVPQQPGGSFFGDLAELVPDQPPSCFFCDLAELVPGDQGGPDFNIDSCITLDVEDELLDFRDFLLTPEDSARLGGSGTDPYGDLVTTVYGILTDQLSAEDEEDPEILGINALAVRPGTEAQSGTPGVLGLEGELFNQSLDIFQAQGISYINVSLFDASVSNLDTIVPPLIFGEPTNKSGSVLANAFNLGPIEGKPLNVEFGIVVVVDASDTLLFLAKENEIKISISTNWVRATVGVNALVSAWRLFSIPLRDVFDIPCWLGTMPVDFLDENGARLEGSPDQGLIIEDIRTEFATLDTNITCINCTSRGFAILPEVFEIIEFHVAETLTTRLQVLLQDMAISEVVDEWINGILAESPQYCPHRTEFINITGVSNLTSNLPTEFPDVSGLSIDTLFFMGVLVGEIGTVFGVETLQEVVDNTPEQEPPPPLEDYVWDSDEVPEDVNLLDWSNPTGIAGVVIGFASSLILGNVTNEATGESEPRINSFAGNFLSDSGTFSLPGLTLFEQFGFVIGIESIDVFGLDSFTRFDGLEVIAPQIFNNEFALDYLNITVSLSIDQPRTEEIPPKNFSISIGMDGIRGAMPIVAVIDNDVLGSLQLGIFLRIENILPCLLSTAYGIEIPYIEAKIDGFSEPSFGGQLPDTEIATQNSISAIYEMDWAESLLENIPYLASNFLQPLVQDQINSQLNSSDCPALIADSVTSLARHNNGFLDFRDFFLPPNKARILNASGTEPYGDIGLSIYETIEEMSGNSTAVNSVFIDPITESQSGVEGMFRYASDVIAFQDNSVLYGMLESIDLRLFDVKAWNLNTVVPPVALLEPTSLPQVVKNIVNFGPVPERPLSLSTNLLISFDGGDESALTMNNEIEIRLSADSMHFATDLFMMVGTTGFLTFPFRDINNIHCWLALLAMPRLDDDEKLPEGSPDQGFGIESFFTIVRNVTSQITCVNCSSRVLNHALQEFDLILNQNRDDDNDAIITNILSDKLQQVVKDAVLSESIQTWVDGLLYEAPRFCPHRPEFEKSVIAPDIVFPSEFPTVSNDSLDAIVFAVLCVIQTASFVILESFVENINITASGNAGLSPLKHAPTSYLSSSPSPGRHSFSNVPDGVHILDFTETKENDDFQHRIGLTIQQVGEYLSGSDYVGGDLRINHLLRDFFLDSNGVLSVEAKELTHEHFGFHVTLETIHIQGLDSVTQIDVLDVVGPQTIMNSVNFQRLSVTMNTSIDFIASRDEPPLNIAITFEARDVNMTMPIHAAFDVDALGRLELGSLLHTKNIIRCLLTPAYDIHFPFMKVAAGKLLDPTINGMLPETTAAIAKLMAATFDLSNVQEMFPSIIEAMARPFANKALSSYVGTSDNCPKSGPGPSSFVDFRQFFSPPGNTGVPGPYGDLPAIFKKYLESVTLDIDPISKTPKLNTHVIAPLTKSQSGEVGTLVLPEELFGVETNRFKNVGLDIIELQFFNGRVEELNTFGGPLQFLQPNVTSPFLLDNRATVGVGEDPLRLQLKVLLKILGDPVLEMRNEMDVTMELSNASMLGVILAKIKAKEFLTFPLSHFFNGYCWMALFARRRGEAEVQEGARFAVDYFEMAFSNMRLDMSCTNCTNRGVEELPVLKTHLKTSGVLDILKKRIVPLAVELFANDGGGFASRMLDNSAKRCPRYASQELSKPNELELPTHGIPSLVNHLSSDSVDALVCTLTTMMQVYVVIIAKTHSGYSIDESDPLASQRELDIPLDGSLLDLNSLGNSTTGRLFNLGINYANDYLASAIVDDNNVEDIMVNSWIRQMNGGPSLSIGLSDFGFDEWGISISNIRLFGLDTFTKFDIIQVIGPQTVRSEFGLERLHIKLDVNVKSSGPGRVLLGDDVDSSTFEVSLELDDVRALVSILIGVDEDKFAALQFGSLMEMRNLFPCLISSLHALELSQMFVTVGTIELIDITGFHSSDIARAVEEFRFLITKQYGDTISSSVPGVFDVMVRALINNWLSYYMNNVAAAECPAPSSSTSLSALIDLRDLLLSKVKSISYGGSGSEPYGDLIHTIVSRFQKMLEVDTETGLSRINKLFFAPAEPSPINIPFDNYSGNLNVFGDGRIGTYNISGDIITFDELVLVGGLDARIAIKLLDLSFENVDTIGAPLSVLELTRNEQYQLNNTISIGVGGGRPFRPSFRIIFELQVAGETSTYNDFRVSIDLHVVTLVVDAILKIAEQRFMAFPLGSLGNYHCWLHMIPAPKLSSRGIRDKKVDPTATLKKLFLEIAKLDVDLSCNSCTSPGLLDLDATLSQLDASDDLTEAVNAGIRYISELMQGDFLQDRVDYMLNLAGRRCPHSPDYEADNTELPYEAFQHTTEADVSIAKILLSASVALFIFIVLTLVATVKWIIRRRHRQWIKSSPESKIRVIQHQEHRRRRLDEELSTSKSMFQSRDIPLYVRYLVPLTITGNIAFFLSGHLNLGGSVNLYADVFGEEFFVEGLFEFSIGKSTVDLWMVGARFTSMLVLLFSVVWPYLKQLTTLFLWFSSPRYVSSSVRGSLFVWLDTLAKWSMVDIMVMIISLVGFRTSIQSPEAAFFPDNMYAFDLVVVPMWGLYANIIAQLISQISSHFIIFYHRKIVSRVTKTYECKNQNLSPEPLGIPVLGNKLTVETQSRDKSVMVAPVIPDTEYKEHARNSLCEGPGGDLAPLASRHEGHVSEQDRNRDHDNRLAPDQCQSATVLRKMEGAAYLSSQLSLTQDAYDNSHITRLFEHGFVRSHRAEDQKLVVRRHVNKTVVLAAVISCGCIIMACFLPVFSIDTFGIFGILLDLGENFRETSRYFSVLGLVGSLMDEAYFLGSPKDFVGLGSIAALFLTTVLLVPLMQITALLYQWFFPMTGKRRNQTLMFIEILQAWEYSEVYLFAVIVESWQLGSVSKFMVNPFCGNLNDEFAALSYYGILENKDAQCFQVEASVKNGSPFMLIGVVLLILVNTYVTKAALQCLRDNDSEQGVFAAPVYEEVGNNDHDTIKENFTKDNLKIESLSPAPILFSDTFRWTLCSRGNRRDKLEETYGESTSHLKSKNGTERESNRLVTGDGKSHLFSLSCDSSIGSSNSSPCSSAESTADLTFSSSLDHKEYREAVEGNHPDEILQKR